MIGCPIDPSVDTLSDGIISPTPVSIPCEIQREAATRIPLLEYRFLEYRHPSLPGGTQEITADAGGTVPGSNALAYDGPALDRHRVGDQLPSATPDQKRDLHNGKGKKVDKMEVSPTTILSPTSPVRATIGDRRGALSCAECRRYAYLPHRHRRGLLIPNFPGQS